MVGKGDKKTGRPENQEIGKPGTGRYRFKGRCAGVQGFRFPGLPVYERITKL